MIDPETGELKRSVFKEMRLNEISAVDVPAQPGATMSIMKRADKKEDDEEDEDEKEKNPFATKKQAEAVVPDHTDVSTSSGAPADSVGTVSKEATMSQKNDQTDQALAVAKQLEEANARVSRAEAVSELNDAQRGIFKSLDEAGQDAFLALPVDARQAEVTKAADANAVVYTDAEGTEYRKQDDQRMVNLAKRADSERALRIAGEEVAKAANLAKRAEGFAHITGGVEAAKLILKGIDSLSADEQAPALEALKAQDANMAKAFSRAGTSEVPSTEVNELERIAKAIRDNDPSLTREQASAKALDTPEGAAAYSKSLGY
jgi:hypothetical protein